MSFGFGIGDIIAVSQLANKVRKRFVDSPDQFKAISDERTRKRLSECFIPAIYISLFDMQFAFVKAL